ncbi:hypothetical protein DF19_25055 [Streptomyces olindensis]|nr:hypothetical protein DF19_25055 [Streptomyces olindensis]
MQDPIRSITLPTTDFGDVTVPEPAWCAGHADHRPGPRAEILHRGPDATLTFRGQHLTAAALVQAPFLPAATPELGGPVPGVSVDIVGLVLDPVGVYELAAALDLHAAALRALAYDLAVILAGGAR